MSEHTIPNADLIRAILDGKVVQKRYPGVGEWRDAAPAASIETLASGSLDYEFRIKPETVVHWHAITRHHNDRTTITGDFIGCDNPERSARGWAGKHNGKVLRLELSDTLEVISVRTEEP